MPAIRLRTTSLAAPLLAVISICLTIAVGVWLPVETLTHVMREGGPIENATAILYLGAVGAVLVMRNPAFGGLAKTASAFVLVCCIAREVSVRRWLLDAPFSAYCCTPDQTRVIIGVLLVLLAIAAAWLVLHYTRALYIAFRRGAPAAITLVTMFICVVLSQVLDRFPKIALALFGYIVSIRGRALALSLEEVLEMMLPALVVLAAFHAHVKPKAGRAEPDAQPSA